MKPNEFIIYINYLKQKKIAICDGSTAGDVPIIDVFRLCITIFGLWGGWVAINIIYDRYINKLRKKEATNESVNKKQKEYTSKR